MIDTATTRQILEFYAAFDAAFYVLWKPLHQLLILLALLAIPAREFAPPRWRKMLLWPIGVIGFQLLLALASVMRSHHFVTFEGFWRVESFLTLRLFSLLMFGAAAYGIGALIARDRPDDESLRRTLYPNETDRAEIIRHGLIVGLAGATLALFTFEFINYTSSEKLQKFNALFDYYGDGIRRTVQLGVMLHAVFVEEILYRLVIQGGLTLFLTRGGRWRERDALAVAILVQAVAWTLVHRNSFAFPWAKYIQIFPFGILQGWLMARRGLWACMMSHFVYNATILLLSLIILPPQIGELSPAGAR